MSKVETSLENAFNLHKKGQLKEALSQYSEIIKQNPKHPTAHFLVGTLYCQLKDWNRALPHLNQAIELSPGHIEAHRNRANLFLSCGKYPEAIGDLKALVLQNPAVFMDQYNLGLAYKHAGEFEKAKACLQKAVSLSPDFLPAQNVLGVVQKDLGETVEATSLFRKILQNKPDWPDAWFNLGVALRQGGDYEEALKAYDRGLKLDPQNAWGHFNKGNCLLLLGRIEEVWPEYDWRLETEPYAYLKTYRQKLWRGESLQNKSLLIIGEQGLADELHFAACIPEILPQLRQLTIECLPKLVPLLAQTFPQAHVVARPVDGTLSPLTGQSYDFMTPMGSLMRWVRPNLCSLITSGAYLKNDPILQNKFSERLKSLGEGLKIGISWQTRTPVLSDSQRSKSYTSFLDWEPLLKTPGVHWVSLQYGDAAPALKEVEEKLSVKIHHFDDVDYTDDLGAVAALIEATDLVISINTTVATLAPALGTETWIVMPWAYGSHWPQNTRADLFLPQMIYKRQPGPGQWRELFASLALEIPRLILSKPGRGM